MIKNKVFRGKNGKEKGNKMESLTREEKIKIINKKIKEIIAEDLLDCQGPTFDEFNNEQPLFISSTIEYNVNELISCLIDDIRLEIEG